VIVINFQTSNTSNDIEKQLLRLTEDGEGGKGNCKFYFNKDLECYDYLVVFEELSKKIKINIPKRNLIFIAGEATSIKSYSQKFMDQFGHIVTCQKKIKHKSKFLRSPGHSWFSQKTHNELMNINSIKKTKLLSIVVSNKTLTKGHRKRLEFCLELKEKLGDKVDLFGRGFNDFEDKWDVIAPYKYSIAIENSIEDDWITEKLGDCYTSHTFPFYYGAPNVDAYYNPMSYELIDITDFDGTLKRIQQILNNEKHYEKHLQYLIEAKCDYLNKHSMLPMICNVINKNIKIKEATEDNLNELTIYPYKIGLFQKTINKFIRHAKRLLNA
jgi:hypothetical protein